MLRYIQNRTKSDRHGVECTDDEKGENMRWKEKDGPEETTDTVRRVVSK